MLKRLLFSVGSLLLLLLLAVLGARGLARLELPLGQPSLALLDAGRRQLEGGLRREGEALPSVAQRLAADATLAQDIRVLGTALANVQGKNIQPAMQARIDNFIG